MSQKELIKKFFYGSYENGKLTKTDNGLQSPSLLLNIFPKDEQVNLLCPCAHLSCDFRMTLVVDIIDDNEFDEFWSHVEEYHRTMSIDDSLQTKSYQGKLRYLVFIRRTFFQYLMQSVCG